MALRETTREDLLRDGKNLFFRGEVHLRGGKLIAGFRQRNQLTLYCNEDPVFHFNADAALRKVYFGGAVYRAQLGQLIKLSRASRGGRVVFRGEPIENHRFAEILDSLSEWLGEVESSLERSDWKVVGEDGGSFRKRLRSWVNQIDRPLKIAMEAGLQ